MLNYFLYFIFSWETVAAIMIGSFLYVVYLGKLHDEEWKKECDGKDMLLRQLREQSVKDKYELNLKVSLISSMGETIKSLSATVNHLEDQIEMVKRKCKLKCKDKANQLISNKNTNNTENECVICLESVPMTCFIPCGHISTCVSCAKCMIPPSCPICRCKDGRFYSIYNATNPKSEKELIIPRELVDKNRLRPEEVIKRKGLIRRFLDRCNLK